MDKNTIWAIVLSTLVMIGFMTYQSTMNPPIEQLPVNTETTNSSEITEDSKLPAFSQEELVVEEQEYEEQTFTISTNVVDITLTNKGGDIIGYELIDHTYGDVGVQMAENITAQNRALSLAFGEAENGIVNDIFKTEVIDEYTIGFSKKFTKNNQQFTLKKLYTFDPEEYLFKLDIRLEGNGYSNSDVAYTLRSAPQIGPFYDVSVDRYEHRTFTFYDGKKHDKKISDGQSKVYDESFNWAGLAGKYFAHQIVATDSTSIKQSVYSKQGEVEDFTNAQFMIERKSNNQSFIQDIYYVYMGPKVDKSLVMYNNADKNNWGLSNLRLDEILRSGWLSWLEVCLKWIMEIFYFLIPNWGVAIILMTILIKLVMYPLTKKSSVATLRMQELQPQMKEIQDKYKGNTEKLNVEMAKFYKEAGYNPMAGCLPLLIQFPLIFAMFGLFNNYFEFRGAMFIPGWIPDLSVSDKLGYFPEGIPFIGGMVISVLPVVYVGSQLLFTKITQSSAASSNPSMKIMLYAMPIMFFFMFYTAPSGLLIYWITSNVLQLIQQVVINKLMSKKRKEMGLEQPKAKEVALPPSAKKRKKK